MRARFADAASDTFRSLRTRNFRLFFFGQLVSQIGTWMQSIAIIWVVLRLTDDGFALGLATAAQFLPVLFLGAWAGVVTDRVDRHRLILATQSAFALVAVGFTVLTFAGWESLPAIYGLSALYGLVTALDNPARKAFVVEMVGETDVPNAVGLNSALMTGSRVVGPALAGLVISTAGAEWCFLGNALTYLAVLVALLRIDRSRLRTSARVARAQGQLRAGFRYVWSPPELKLPLILLTVIGTLAFEFQVTLPLLAERSFGGSAGTFTMLYSAMSVGSVVGALVIARRTDADTRMLVKAAGAMGVSMVLLALAPNQLIGLLVIVPVGFSSVFLMSGSNAVVNLHAEPSMRGRALALTSVVFLGSTPIGGPIAGWVSEQLGPRAGVGMGALATLLAVAWTSRELRRLEARAGAGTGEPVTTGRAAEPSLPRSGVVGAQSALRMASAERTK